MIMCDKLLNQDDVKMLSKVAMNIVDNDVESFSDLLSRLIECVIDYRQESNDSLVDDEYES